MNLTRVRAFTEAMTRKDLESMLLHMSEDVVLRTPLVAEPIQGKAAIRPVVSALLGVVDRLASPPSGCRSAADIGSRWSKGTMKQATPVGLIRKLATASGAFAVNQARVRCWIIFISASETTFTPT